MSFISDNIRNWGDSFEALASDLGVEVEALHAVAATEVGSLPPPPIGLPIIRFEVHSFLKKTSVDVSSRIELRDAPTAWHKDAHWYKSSKEEDWERVHSGDQSDEWGALAAASAFDPEAAFHCASWGVGQIMGWHYKTCGYGTAREMVADAMRGPELQFQQWGEFFKNEKGGSLVDSMKTHNWYQFAYVYNGPGQPDYYSDILSKNYAKAVQAIAEGITQVDHNALTLNTWTARQEALETLGYDPGPIDGIYGPSTKKALKEFQADQGLTPDGIWGAKTEATMDKALEAIV